MVTVKSLDLSTYVNGDTIFANQDSASYQWIDCNNSFMPITGETDKHFIATTNGDYAVIISYDGCTDTSACVNMVVTGLEDQNKEFDITIYPNPNNGNFKFEISNFESDIEMQIMNIHGQMMRSEIMNVNTSLYTGEINLTKMPKGIYFIRLRTNEMIKIEKVVVQ